VARYLKLRSFGRDLRGLLSVILHLPEWVWVAFAILGPWGCLGYSPLLPIGRPASCPTCVSSIFIMMNTSRKEFPTSVTLPSKFSNISSPYPWTWTWSFSSHSSHVDLASAAFRCWAFFLYLHLLHPPFK
jgi:hypothetical protein